MTRARPFKFEVWDQTIYEVEIDLADPKWAYLTEHSENPDEWIAMLDDEANQPDSEIAVIVKRLAQDALTLRCSPWSPYGWSGTTRARARSSGADHAASPVDSEPTADPSENTASATGSSS